MSVCWSQAFTPKTGSEELGNRLQTPTLIGCKLLRNRNTFLLCFARFAVISEALYYATLSRFFQEAITILEKNALSLERALPD